MLQCRGGIYLLLLLLLRSSNSKTNSSSSTRPSSSSSSNGVVSSSVLTTNTAVNSLTWIYTSPEAWYSQHDLCIIKNWHKSSNLTLVQIAQQRCHQDVLADEWTGRLFVGYGHSYTATCSPPLTDRPQYMQALAGFNDATSMHLVEAMRHLRLLNRTLVFFGDSVMRQNYIAVLAELKRLDKHIDIDRWASKKLMANKTTLPQVVNVFQDERNDFEGGGATVWFSRINKGRPIPIYYIACHRLERGQFDIAMALLKTVESKTKGVVVIANVGLHYNDRAEGFKALSTILPSLGSFASRSGKRNVVIWRETTAQHFEYRAQGYFEKEAGKKSHHCVPHSMIKPVDQNDALDWRNEDVKTIISVNGLTNIHYLPFYAATVPLFAMHPDKDTGRNRHYVPGTFSKPGDNTTLDPSVAGDSAFALHVPIDCTHFCQLPTLWQPVWRAFADVVQEQLDSTLSSLDAKEVDVSVSPASGGQHSHSGKENTASGDKVEHMKPSAAVLGLAPGPTKRPSAVARHNNSSQNGQSAEAKAALKIERKKEQRTIQYIRLNGSSRSVPIGPNFVLNVVNPEGAIVRNGIDIDTSAIVMKIPQKTNVSSIRSVSVIDDGFRIVRYEVRNNKGQVEGWLSSNIRDETHSKIVEIMQFCVECIEDEAERATVGNGTV